MIITIIIGLLFVIAGIMVLGRAETHALSALPDTDWYREIERWAQHMIAGVLLLMSGIAILGYVAGHV
ncbi:MAG TPA: hypothetical protein VNE18_10340 [Rhodanobacter sp.]|nr:hypothetical protein [Rhodanobacter sp.]